jgi:hypothetical protein
MAISYSDSLYLVESDSYGQADRQSEAASIVADFLSRLSRCETLSDADRLLLDTDEDMAILNFLDSDAHSACLAAVTLRQPQLREGRHQRYGLPNGWHSVVFA